MRKVPVGVLAQFDAEGRLLPVSITWENGRVYHIDRVLGMRVSRMNRDNHRYDVVIHTQPAYLYRAGDRWYMEAE
ncbi:MAG: hypothetical protein IJ048_07345 [Clostridia bacterium]|nr:hypothetical protein [Clostridia bacterium]